MTLPILSYYAQVAQGIRPYIPDISNATNTEKNYLELMQRCFLEILFELDEVSSAMAIGNQQ
jgi:hypothetical protein